MLDSVKIQRRQSEIRQALAELVGKDTPTEDETRQMQTLDTEYRSNETRYRAALIAEDEERREAGADLETRSEQEWADLMAGFEVRQVAAFFDEGREFSGQTAEIVTELRSAGGYRGVPVPLEALETRNTVSGGTPDPTVTRPIIDRLFAESVAGRIGAQMISIPQGSTEWPVTTSGIAAGWQDGEGANVPTAAAFTTTDKALAPDNTFGVQARITRKALKQTGAGLEQAIRRDVANAIRTGLDRAITLGTGSDGQPLGVMTGAGTYGITSTAIDAAASWAAFREAVVRFLNANAAGSPGAVRMLIRPEVWAALDDTLITDTAVSEWDRLTRNIPTGNIAMTSNALADPDGSPAATDALLTTNAGGVPPAFVGMWGGVDMIRDPYTDAQSGGLRLTALVTADVTVSRAEQLEVLTGIE